MSFKLGGFSLYLKVVRVEASLIFLRKIYHSTGITKQRALSSADPC